MSAELKAPLWQGSLRSSEDCYSYWRASDMFHMFHKLYIRRIK